MAVINDLIERISDPELRRRISEEVARMQKQKKFGLVFEEHLPEATPLYDIPIKKKSLVSLYHLLLNLMAIPPSSSRHSTLNLHF